MALLALSACAPAPIGQKNITNASPEPTLPDNAVVCNHTVSRGQLCMMLYQPVCGSNNQTYINGCTACKDENADYYVPDACPGQAIASPYGSSQPDAFTECTADQHNGDFCVDVMRPVCGAVDNGIRCVRAPCPSTYNRTYSNGCVACLDQQVYGFWPGPCPSDIPGGKKPAPGALFCEPMAPEGACTMDYNSVCGNDGRTYGNACGACRAGNQYYVPGKCNNCPAGYDSYAAQLGSACVKHYGQEEILTWKECRTSTACGGLSCGYASIDTTDAALTWTNDTAAWRCLPQDYAEYMVNSGLRLLDENGRESTVIA